MNFLRTLTFPFAGLYSLITRVRNILYDRQIFKSISFDIPVISVGNLSAGGTGKTPHIEFLIRLLSVNNYKVATLSRGYRRKSKGFQIAGQDSDSFSVGDEPLQFYHKFPGVTVAVEKERILGIPMIISAEPKTDVILLDDAFQHRSVSPGLNILITPFHNLFTDDKILPLGNLRESAEGYKRADIIIVSKTPSSVSDEEKKKVSEKIKPFPAQSIFFSGLKYGIPWPVLGKPGSVFNPKDPVILLTGIADPEPLLKHIKENYTLIKHISYPDHFTFSKRDIKSWKDQLTKLDPSAMIITTEKDAMRLLRKEFTEALHELKLFALPVEITFEISERNQLEKKILNYVRENK